jgi:nucleoside-diphosphate-sugar epimerase
MSHPNDDYLNAYARRTVLVTGGLGFIGSNLAHRLAACPGAQIRIADCLVPDCGGNPFNLDGLEGRVEVHDADIGDAKAMTPLLAGVDYVFNLAGNVSHIDSMRNPLLDLKLNTADHVSLLETCRQVAPGARIILSSTRQVYGRPDYLPVDEKHPVRPVDVNGVNKLAGEHFHLVYHQVHHLRAVILRLTNTYGPRQLVRHARQGFIGWFVRQIVDGEEIKLYGDGMQVRDLAYVGDVVEGLLRAGACEETYGQVLNLGGSEPTPLLTIARLLIAAAGTGSVALVPWPPEKQAIDIGSCYCDYSAATRLLGWRPRTELAVGLAEMVAFYQRNRARYWSA